MVLGPNPEKRRRWNTRGGETLGTPVLSLHTRVGRTAKFSTDKRFPYMGKHKKHRNGQQRAACVQDRASQSVPVYGMYICSRQGPTPDAGRDRRLKGLKESSWVGSPTMSSPGSPTRLTWFAICIGIYIENWVILKSSI